MRRKISGPEIKLQDLIKKNAKYERSLRHVVMSVEALQCVIANADHVYDRLSRQSVKSWPRMRTSIGIEIIFVRLSE